MANEQLSADEVRLQLLLSEAEKRIGILECDSIAAVRLPSVLGSPLYLCLACISARLLADPALLVFSSRSSRVC